MNARLCSAWLPQLAMAAVRLDTLAMVSHCFADSKTHTLLYYHSFAQPRSLLPTLGRPPLLFHAHQPHAFLCIVAIVVVVAGVAAVDKAAGERSHCSPLSSQSLIPTPYSSLSDSFLLPNSLSLLFCHSFRASHPYFKASHFLEDQILEINLTLF